jgi:hypothetical protein
MTVGGNCKPSLEESNPKSVDLVTKGYFSFDYPLVTPSPAIWIGATGMPQEDRCLGTTKSLRISLCVCGEGKEMPLIVRRGKTLSQKVIREISGI